MVPSVLHALYHEGARLVSILDADREQLPEGRILL